MALNINSSKPEAAQPQAPTKTPEQAHAAITRAAAEHASLIDEGNKVKKLEYENKRLEYENANFTKNLMIAQANIADLTKYLTASMDEVKKGHVSYAEAVGTAVSKLEASNAMVKGVLEANLSEFKRDAMSGINKTLKDVDSGIDGSINKFNLAVLESIKANQECFDKILKTHQEIAAQAKSNMQSQLWLNRIKTAAMIASFFMLMNILAGQYQIDSLFTFSWFKLMTPFKLLLH